MFYRRPYEPYKRRVRVSMSTKCVSHEVDKHYLSAQNAPSVKRISALGVRRSKTYQSRFRDIL